MANPKIENPVKNSQEPPALHNDPSKAPSNPDGNPTKDKPPVREPKTEEKMTLDEGDITSTEEGLVIGPVRKAA